MKVFLSCVSAQFKPCRDALASDLRAIGCTVNVQEDARQGPRTLIERIAKDIADCDRVILLIGDGYGLDAIGEGLPAGAPQRSITQWEWHLARGERLDGSRATPKELWVYCASARFLAGHAVAQAPDAAERQRAFVAEVEASGKDRREFDGLDHLCRQVLRDGWQIQERPRRPRNLPYDSLGLLFKGRDAVVEDLHERLRGERGRPTAIVAKQAIHGLGGVGKTRLAVEYALRHADEYSALLFVIADSPQALDTNLAALSEPAVLDLPERETRDQDVRVEAVLRWFEEHSGWLLILDNVDQAETAATVEGLLPRLHAGHVLITSRLSAWSASVDARELDVLDADDAARFLLERTQDRRRVTSDDEIDARRLAATLGGLALALEQAGAFIFKRRVSLGDYERRWCEREQGVREWHDAKLMKYPCSLAVTWDTSVSQLDAPSLALLRLLCWLAPEPLPRGVLETEAARAAVREAAGRVALPERRAGDVAVDPEGGLEGLADLSLVKWESGGAAVRVHRLVQEVTRERLPVDERGASLRGMLGVVNAYLPDDPPPWDVRSWPRWQPLQGHVAALVSAADDAGIAEPTGPLMNEYALLLQATNRLSEAEPLMRRALAIDESSYGPDHPNVAIRLSNLAALLKATNRLAEAEPFMVRVVEIFEKSLGHEHPNVATALNNLAQLLQDTNRLADAEPLMRRALAIDESSCEPDHPNVARDLNNLAQLLQATNRLAEAEPLMRRALAIDESSYGPDHPDVATDLNNLALLLRATNRLAEAEALMRRALAIDESSYGSEHPEVATDLNNLAQLLKATNRLAEAEALMRRALAIDEPSYGPDHPKVAIRLHNLAQLLEATNRLAEAEPLMRRALEILLAFTQATGHEHPHLRAAHVNYVGLLTALGRSEVEARVEIRARGASFGVLL